MPNSADRIPNTNRITGLPGGTLKQELERTDKPRFSVTLLCFYPSTIGSSRFIVEVFEKPEFFGDPKLVSSREPSTEEAYDFVTKCRHSKENGGLNEGYGSDVRIAFRELLREREERARRELELIQEIRSERWPL